MAYIPKTFTLDELTERTSKKLTDAMMVFFFANRKKTVFRVDKKFSIRKSMRSKGKYEVHRK